MRNIYRTDGSVDGFFTAVFDAYKDENAYLTSSAYLQQGLFDTFRFVETDEEKAKRVVKKLYSLSRRGTREIFSILRTSEEEREQVAFSYAKKIVRYGESVRGRLADADVRRALDLSGRVWTEVHRLKGFLRFRETAEGVLYAPCTPDNDVVELLESHFCKRFQGLAFVIHDVKRGLALLYDGKECLLARADNAEVILSEKELAFSALWKKYYQTVTIPSRKNVRQQKNYMPVRYWSMLTEEPWEE